MRCPQCFNPHEFFADMAQETLVQQLSAFWTVDTPAIGGLERILLYGALLIACHWSHIARPPIGDSPLQAPELFANTDLDLFFEVRGAIEYLPLSWLRSFGYKGIDRVRRVVYISWVLCILGAFGHIPVVTTSLGVLFLEMIKISCTGVGHRMHLVVYSLVFLSLSNSRRSYSVDNYLSEHFPNYWNIFSPHNSHPIFYSGIATKLCLVASSFTLWAGAVCKIRNGGWRWLDGKTLAWQTISSPFGALPLMKSLFAIPVFACFAAASAIVFEAGSFIIPFPQLIEWRLIWMFMCFTFHLVIYLTMNPNYLPQSITYVPCVLAFSELPKPVFVMADASSDPFGFTCIAFATLIVVVLFGVVVFRIESWPFTCIPMYSYYRGDFLAAVVTRQQNRRDIEEVGVTINQLQHLALEYNTINPRCIGWLDSWVDLRLVSRQADGASRKVKGERRSNSPSRNAEESNSYSLRDFIREGRAQRSLYRLALSKVICETVLWISNCKTKSSTDDNPAVAYLNTVLTVINRRESTKARLVMEKLAGKQLRETKWDMALCYRDVRGTWKIAGSVPYT